MSVVWEPRGFVFRWVCAMTWGTCGDHGLHFGHSLEASSLCPVGTLGTFSAIPCVMSEKTPSHLSMRQWIRSVPSLGPMSPQDANILTAPSLRFCYRHLVSPPGLSLGLTGALLGAPGCVSVFGVLKAAWLGGGERRKEGRQLAAQEEAGGHPAGSGRAQSWPLMRDPGPVSRAQWCRHTC